MIPLGRATPDISGKIILLRKEWSAGSLTTFRRLLRSRSAGTTVMNDSALIFEQQGDSLPITSDSPRLGSRPHEVPGIENGLHDSWFTSPQVLSLQSSGMGALFIGKLRLVLQAENDFPRYIWGGTSQDGTEPESTVDFKKTTMYVDSALIVSFKRYDEPYSICCVVRVPFEFY